MSKFIKSDASNFKKFEFQNIEAKSLNTSNHFKKFDTEKISNDRIREDRLREKEFSFKINQFVKDHRGLTRQENDDFEMIVNEEVERRVARIIEEKEREGFSRGLTQGELKATQDASMRLDQEINNFCEDLNKILSESHLIYEKHRDNILNIVKKLTKWTTLQEVKNDSYLEMLLSKLFSEIKEKSHLIIRMNPQDYQKIKNLMPIFESKIGPFPHLKLEQDEAITSPGIILESDHSLIDATIENQLEAIERSVDSLGVESHGNN